MRCQTELQTVNYSFIAVARGAMKNAKTHMQQNTASNRPLKISLPGGGFQRDSYLSVFEHDLSNLLTRRG